MLAETILMLRAEAAQELVVVAVPLFPAKQRERGYNQSELLADAAIAELRESGPEWKLTTGNWEFCRGSAIPGASSN